MDLTEFSQKHGKQWEGFFMPSDMGRDFFAMLESLRPKRDREKAGDANVALEYVAKCEQHEDLISSLRTIKAFSAPTEPLETTFLGQPPANLSKPVEEKTNA